MFFRGNCYLFSKSQQSWHDSVTACQEVRTQLVVIKSDEEQVGLRMASWSGACIWSLANWGGDGWVSRILWSANSTQKRRRRVGIRESQAPCTEMHTRSEHGFILIHQMCFLLVYGPVFNILVFWDESPGINIVTMTDFKLPTGHHSIYFFMV